MRIRSFIAICLAVILALSLAACGKNPEVVNPDNKPADSGATTTTAGETKQQDTTEVKEDDKYGGTASIVITGDVQSLIIAASQGGNDDCTIAMILFDFLTMYNPNTGEYEGRILESWEHNEDYTEWTMHVRPGIKWHDGVELTAEDIVFTSEYLANPDLDIYAGMQVESTEQYELVDKYTYKIKTEYPNTSVLAAWSTPLPKHIWENVDPSNFSKAKEGSAPIGCGPFKFVEYKVGEYIKFERFDDYWGGKPYLDTLYLRIIGDNSAAVAALESNQVDFVNVDATIAETMVNKEGISLFKGASGNVMRLYFNNEEPRFQDVRVRQAFAHLMQREVYCEQAMKGFADPAYSDWAPTDFYYLGDAYKKYDYNIDKACELLEEAGWKVGADGIREKDGERLEFEAFYSAAQAGTALLIMQPVFEQAGIKLIPKMPDDATLDEIWDTHNYTLMIMGTTMGPDPSRYSYIFGTADPTWNIMVYYDETVYNLFLQAMGALNEDEQKQLYQQIQTELANQLPNIPLWYRHTIYAINSKLRIEEATPVGYLHWKFLHYDKLYMMK